MHFRSAISVNKINCRGLDPLIPKGDSSNDIDIAMDSEKVERLRERLLLCVVCMDEYKDPRILPCHHTLCFECISKVVEHSSTTGRFFRCPQCRSDVCVPRGGIADLPINFYILSLQDELGTNGYASVCNICDRDWLTSQFRCIDCDLDICKFCIHAHRLETHQETPKILRIETTASQAQLSSSQMCSEHPEETLQLFCSTCQQPICIDCSCSQHKRHNVVPIAAKLQESKSFLQSEFDRLTGEKRSALKAIELIQQTKDEVMKSSNSSILAIDEAAHLACEKIMKKKAEIEREILKSETDQVQVISNVMDSFKTHAQRIDRGLAFLSDLEDSDVCLEIVDTYREYSAKLAAARKDIVSKRMLVQHHLFDSSNRSEIFDVSNGIFRSLFFCGKLGCLSCKKMQVVIDQKTMIPRVRSRGIWHIFQHLQVRYLLIFFIIFFFSQWILYFFGVWTLPVH